MEHRSISDNLRVINLALRESELQNKNISIVALDAKKAFDSVRHEFIYKILKHMGLHGFAETFKILYHEQNIRISLNGQLTEQYFPERGVKQGDALSCIIFNLVIEIILRSINQDETITPLKITHSINSLPIAVGYADDITCIIQDSNDIQKIFKHYETFTTILSTLKLVYDIGSCLFPSKLIGIFSARIKSEIHVNHPTCTPNTFCSSSPTYKLQIYYFLSEPSNT